MTGRLSYDVLLHMSNMIAKRLGLHYPRERWPDLERALLMAAAQSDSQELNSLLELPGKSNLSKGQMEILINHLTVGETYFFRDNKLFDALRNEVLPELIGRRRGKDQYLRIWSAGCCTGEEPYSIAILLRQLIPDITSWNITLLATDINPNFLKKMESGRYRDWSFRDTQPDFRYRYFTKTADGCYQIEAGIKQAVTIDYLNLAADNYPSLHNNTNAMDLIICRNVLIYLVPELIMKIGDGFNKSLTDGGYLIVAPSEVSSITSSGLSAVNYPGTILFRKGDVIPSVMPLPGPGQWTLFPLPVSERQSPDLAGSAMQVTTLTNEIPIPVSGKTSRITEPGIYARAEDLYKKGFNTSALKILEEAVQNGKDDTKLFGLLAHVHANLGNLHLAFTWSEKAITSDKMNPSLHYLQAILLQEQKHYEAAIASLRCAIYLDQQFILAHMAMGSLLSTVGKSKESYKSFKNAMQYLKAMPAGAEVPESDGTTTENLMKYLENIIALHKEYDKKHSHETTS